MRLIDKEGILDTSLKARAYYDAFQVTQLPILTMKTQHRKGSGSFLYR